ncbi:MAG: ABC transporter permease [Chloroflexota bacterium]
MTRGRPSWHDGRRTETRWQARHRLPAPGQRAQRDYLRTVRRRGFIFGTLLLPLGLAALFGLSAVLTPSTLQGAARRARRSPWWSSTGRRCGSRPRGAAAARGGRRHGGPAHPRELIAEYYVVPTTWPGSPDVQRVEAGGRPLDVNAMQRRSTQDEALAAVLRAALLSTSGVSPDVAVRIVAPVKVTAVTVDGTPASELGAVASFLVPFGFTLLFVMSIFITSGYPAPVGDRGEGEPGRGMLSSVPSLPLMAGKVLGLGAAGLTQVAIWVAATLLAIPLISAQVGGLGAVSLDPATMLLALVYFVLGYLAYGAIFAAMFGAIARQSRAQQYFFGFMAVIPLIFGSAFLGGDVSSALVWALALIPLTTPATMLLVLAVSPAIPIPMVVASLVSLSLFALLATVASARVFRATLLLYGVRPSLGRIVGAILARD